MSEKINKKEKVGKKETSKTTEKVVPDKNVKKVAKGAEATAKNTKVTKKEPKKIKKEVGKELLHETKKATEKPEDPIISPYKEKFLEVIGEMLKYEKSIGNLIFNGIFRLPANRRLYEFSDEEVLKAFSQQLNVMKNKRERAISEESKLKKLRGVAM